jgi:hemolysin III
VWLLAALGAVFKLCWVGCPKWVSSVIYIPMGWSCLAVMPQVVAALPPRGFFWLLSGGVVYTAGGVIYALKP